MTGNRRQAGTGLQMVFPVLPAYSQMHWQLYALDDDTLVH